MSAKLTYHEQYVSKMNKLNFDLKLEVFHRTQQMGALEKKLERMKEMEEELRRMHKLEAEVEDLRSAEKENRTLRESNEQLRQELDKRDQAVTEAVQLICQLEAKIEELETGGRTSQQSMSRLLLDGPNATTPKAQQAVEIPERTSSRQKTSRSQPSQPRSSDLRHLSKAPSFLRADNQSTATLRSLYAPEDNKSHTTVSELTKSESLHTMNDTSEPGSPRLSVLSEASELNPFDTPSKWNEFDKLDIPVRKAPSTGSLDSYIPPTEREESKSEQVDQWLQSRPDMSETIIRRRQNRTLSDASKTGAPPFNGELYSNKPRGRPRVDTSLFGGARLPPTPDTMSTAYAAVNNGSNGSIAPEKSPKPERDHWFAGRRLDRHRSADEFTTRRSFDGSDITDSMQTNCSDTPRLGVTNDESPTIFPFSTVASKASELLGPGSPNNPAINSFSDLFHQDSKDEAIPPTIKRDRTPSKTTTTTTESHSTKHESSPPLTPQDWLAAATRTPRSRKEQSHGLRIEQRGVEPNCNVISQAAFDDGQSIDSIPTEPDHPGIPTLDMNTLDILEQPFAEPLAAIPGPPPEQEQEPRRRLVFRPSFLSHSNGPRRLQSSPMAPDYIDDEDDGAPSPVIQKHRNTGGARRRPVSQIVTDSAELYSSSIPAQDNIERNFAPKAPHQSFMETRDTSLPAHSGSATISGRPSTSHSMEHKRRSSLGIFGWMKNVSGKRSEPATPTVAEAFADAAQRKEQRSRPVKEHPGTGSHFPHANTPDSMDAPRSEMSMHTDDTARRPRYMGRRSRRG